MAELRLLLDSPPFQGGGDRPKGGGVVLEYVAPCGGSCHLHSDYDLIHVVNAKFEHKSAELPRSRLFPVGWRELSVIPRRCVSPFWTFGNAETLLC